MNRNIPHPFTSPEYELIGQARELVRKIQLALLRGCRNKTITTLAVGDRYVQAIEHAKARLQRRQRTLLPRAHVNIYRRD